LALAEAEANREHFVNELDNKAMFQDDEGTNSLLAGGHPKN
jgi:hypothetical protein